MKAGIIGGGIIGLTTGVVLAEAGYDVSVLTREPIEETTSYAAAAICYPVSVEDSDRVNRWFARTNTVLAELARDQISGVSPINWHKYSLEEQCPPLSWMDYVSDGVARPLLARECPEPFRSGVFARLYLMHVDHYCAYLKARFCEAGGAYEIRNVERVEDVVGVADVLINETGVYAREFCDDDDVYPARGQVVVVKNPGVEDHLSSFGSKNYIYPRGEQCVVGGSFDEHEWDRAPDEALTREILDWAAGFDAKFADTEILDVRVGLRPMRPNVRLEKEMLKDGAPLIHNYGHGGAGYTLSWGCAFDVLEIVKNL